MYNQVANGDFSYVEALKQQHEDNVSKSVQEARNMFMGEEGEDDETSSDEEDEVRVRL